MQLWPLSVCPSVCLSVCLSVRQQEAQLMLTTGSTRLAVSRGQQTWYHSTCYMQGLHKKSVIYINDIYRDKYHDIFM